MQWVSIQNIAIQNVIESGDNKNISQQIRPKKEQNCVCVDFVSMSLEVLLKPLKNNILESLKGRFEKCDRQFMRMISDHKKDSK